MENFLENLLDLFLPKRCVNCGTFGNYLCTDCLSLIEILQNCYCPFCSIPKFVPNGRTCSNCRASHYLDGLFAAVSFNNFVIRKTVHYFKYPPFIKALTAPLANLILEHLNFVSGRNKFNDFVIVPIPLSKKRLRFRGFNQSEEIAKILSSNLNLETRNLLIRNKDIRSQTELNKEQRLENIKGVFEINKAFLAELNGAKLLLVDDVFTTGATMDEAAKILKQNGAREVWAVVVARE